MFAISISFGASVWRLLYKDEKKAIEAFKILSDAVKQNKTTEFSAASSVELVDDYGQHLVAPAGALQGLMFEDLEKSKLGNIEMSLHTARTQMKLQQTAEHDPVLRAGMSRGPGIIAPMGPGPMPPNGGRLS